MNMTKRVLALLLVLCLMFGNVMPAMATGLDGNEPVVVDETQTETGDITPSETTESEPTPSETTESEPTPSETTESDPAESESALSETADSSLTEAAISNGVYVISTNGLTFTALAETKTYGYPGANDAGSYTSADAMTITNVDGGITIQDCYGRYVYQTGTYNSFNVNTTAPSEGHVWKLMTDGTSQYLVNSTTGKTLAYSTSYSSWGAYEDVSEGYHTALSFAAYVEPEVPDDGGEEITGVTYTFSNYTAGTQYAANEEHVLDDVVTVITNDAHFTTQLRLYDSSSHDSTAVIKSAKYIDTIVLNAGNAAATLNVYGSNDGETWTLITGLTTTSGYADHSVDVPDGYNYLKLDAVGAQVRVAYMTIAFGDDVPAGGDPETPVTPAAPNENNYGTPVMYLSCQTNEEHLALLGFDADYCTAGTVGYDGERFGCEVTVQTAAYAAAVAAEKLPGHTMVTPENDTITIVAIWYEDHWETVYDESLSQYVYFTCDGETDPSEPTEVTIADGDYVISDGTKTMSALAEAKTYGYPTGVEVAAYTSADKMTITNVDGGFTIQDCYGRYVYQTGTYNSFNVSTTAPESGHIWQLMTDGTNQYLVNTTTEKTLAYSSSYSSWGAYADVSGDEYTYNLTITAYVEPEVDPDEGGETETPAASISFADGSLRTSYSAEQQVWTSGNLVLTNDKASSTSNVYDIVTAGFGEIRLYASSKVTIAYPGMTKVVFTCDDYKDTYVSTLESCLSSFGTVTVDGLVVTLELSEACNSFTYLATAQHRLTNLAVYGTGEAVDEEEFVKPTTPAEIVAAAYNLETGATLAEGPYTLTGKITEIDEEGYNTEYSNITVTMAVEGCEDKPIVCYRMKGDGADNLAVGDIITVTGELVNYKGTIEFTQGCTLDAVEKYIPEGSDPSNPAAVEFAWNENSTEGTIDVEIPANSTYYVSFYTGNPYRPAELVLWIDGEEYDTVCSSTDENWMPVPVVVELVNDSAEAVTKTLTLAYPAGSQMNPANLNVYTEGESWDETEGENVAWVSEGSWDGYQFTWTAPKNGELTITAHDGKAGWSYAINNLTAYQYGDAHCSADAPDAQHSETVTVSAGDEIQVLVNSCGEELYSMEPTPAGDIHIFAYFAPEVGTLENPYVPNWTYNDDGSATATITVPANTTYQVALDKNGMALSINDEFVCVITGNWYEPQIIELAGAEEGDRVFTLKLTAPEGSWNNPAELVIGENTVELGEGAQYYYNWNVTEPGELTIAPTGEKWFYSVAVKAWNEDWGFYDYVYYGDNHYYNDEEEVVASETVTVEPGQIVQVIVGTGDNEAGTVSFSADFVPAEGSASNPYNVYVQGPDEWTGGDAYNTTHYYNVFGVRGMMMMIGADPNVVMEMDGQTYTFENGYNEIMIEGNPMMGRMPVTVSFTGTGDEYAGNYSFAFYYPAGTINNPAELALGKTTVKLAANDADGYNYYFDVDDTGYFTLTMNTASNWVYTINVMTWDSEYNDYVTTTYGDIHAASDGVKSETILVDYGSRICVNVGTENWGAGTLSFTTSFASKEIDLISGKSITLSFTDPATGKAIAANKANWKIIAVSVQDENGGALPVEDFAKYATLNASGKITSVAGLTTPVAVVVSAVQKDNADVSNTFVVYIRPAVKEITIKEAFINEETGDWEYGEALNGTTYQFVPNMNGFNLKLEAFTAPDEALREVTWKSSNTKVLTVDERGKVKPVYNEKTGKYGSGLVTLTATAADGSGVKATVKVNVSFVADYIRVEPKNYQWIVGAGKTVTMVTTVDPNATNKKVAWTLKLVQTDENDEIVYDEEGNFILTDLPDGIATISANGVLKAGTNVDKNYLVAVIGTVQDDGGAWYIYPVWVAPLTHTVEITGAPETHDVNSWNTYYLETQCYSKTGAELGYNATTWKSSNAQIAYVADDGQLIFTGKTGKVTLTATAIDGSNKSARAVINVVKAPDTVLLNMNEAVVAANRNVTLKATVGVAVGYNEETQTPILDTAVTDKKVNWSFADPDAAAAIGAKVSNGTVSANAKLITEPVTLTVVATANMGNSYGWKAEASCDVTFYPATTKITLHRYGKPVSGTLTMDDDYTMVLHAECEPYTAADLYTWKSSNTKVADVRENPDGSVTVIPNGKLGNAVITATAADGSGKTAKVTVKIVKKVDTLEIAPNIGVATTKSINLNTFLTVNPSDASNKKVTWSFAAQSVDAAKTLGVTLNASGTLSAAKLKTLDAPVDLYVTVKAADGFGATATKKVTIYPATTKIDLVNTNGGAIVTGTKNLDVNDTLTLAALTTPENALGKYTWTISNKNIATIVENEDGTITVVPTGTKTGNVTITAKALDGTNKTAKVTIKVVKAVQELNEFYAYVAAGKSVQLAKKVVFAPADATNKTLTWSMQLFKGYDENDEMILVDVPKEIATLNTKTGVLTAGKNLEEPADILVTFTSNDGYGATGYAYVTVMPVAIKGFEIAACFGLNFDAAKLVTKKTVTTAEEFVILDFIPTNYEDYLEYDSAWWYDAVEFIVSNKNFQVEWEELEYQFVDENGEEQTTTYYGPVVRAVNPDKPYGTVKVTLKATDGSNATSYVTIKFVQPTPAT